MDWFLKLLLPDLSDRNERDSGSGSGFHLPSRQVEFPAGVRTEYTESSGFSVATAIATRILAHLARHRVPVLERFLAPARRGGRRWLGQRGERTRRCGQTPLTLRRSRVYRRVTWFLGHIVPDTFIPR